MENTASSHVTSSVCPAAITWTALALLVCWPLVGCGTSQESHSPRQAPGTATELPLEIRLGDSVAPRIADRIRSIANAAAPRLQDKLTGSDRTPVQPFRIVVHADPSQIPDGLAESVSERAPGFALRGRNEIHLVLSRMRPPAAPLDKVVEHELVHVLLDQAIGSPRALWIPRWVHEGLAQVLTGSAWQQTTEDILFFPVRADTLPLFADLRDRFPEREDDVDIAYAMSRSFVGWLENSIGLEPVLAALHDLKSNKDFPRALVRVGGGVLVEHEMRWREYLAYGSGAGMRFVSNNCFAYTGILAFVLLALAAGRIYAREDRTRTRMARAEERERLEAEAAARTLAEGGGSDDDGDDPDDDELFADLRPPRGDQSGG